MPKGIAVSYGTDVRLKQVNHKGEIYKCKVIDVPVPNSFFYKAIKSKKNPIWHVLNALVEYENSDTDYFCM